MESMKDALKSEAFKCHSDFSNNANRIVDKNKSLNLIKVQSGQILLTISMMQWTKEVTDTL